MQAPRAIWRCSYSASRERPRSARALLSRPAIADFTKAISIDPDAIYGYRMRGRAYYFLNQFDNAMKDFDAALRIDAKDSETISFVNDLKRKQRGR